MNNTKAFKLLTVFTRVLLAIIYLWVVADRVGLLGEAGQMGVVWGNFNSFLDYTHTLNSWAPRMFSDILGYAATILEVVLAVMFIIGFRLKEAFILSILLLSAFLFSLITFVGLSNSIDYIIFTSVIIVLTGVLLKFEMKSIKRVE